MKKKKAIARTLLGLTALILIVIIGLFIWSYTGTYSPGEVALSALKSSKSVTVAINENIVFTPTDQTGKGLIFYPGGLVDPSAYAPVLRMISEKGIFVVINPMPFNLAILDSGAAMDVIDAYPHINSWTIAGHSLGGAAAAIFANNHADQIDSIAFWDSYPPDSSDLSENSFRVLSIFGTIDNFPNTENFDDKRHLLPVETMFVPIEGANHSQFGDYGLQKDDVLPSISLGEQHQQVAQIMLEFLFQE